MMARAGRSALLALAVGYILFFYSESMFWAVWRPEVEPGILVLTWLAYSFSTWLVLAAIRHWRVDGPWPLLLAGALYGWIIEGIFAMTVYGDPSMPFPFTIAWTGLAWHGPISLLLGFHVLGLALREPQPGPTLVIASGLGLFWGVWGFGWLAETPPVGNDPLVFALNAAGSTALLALAYALVPAGDPAGFAPSRWALMGAIGAVVLFFLFATIPTVETAPFVLLPLLGLLWWGLRRHRARRAPGCLLAAHATPVRAGNLLALAAMPAVATAAYVALSAGVAPSQAVMPGTAILTSLVGTILFAMAMRRAFGRRS
jgi:hypothetical protein